MGSSSTQLLSLSFFNDDNYICNLYSGEIDITAPTITITPDVLYYNFDKNSQDMPNPVASSADNDDNDIRITYSGAWSSYNSSSATTGTYYIHYITTDNAGNQSQEVKVTIIVKADNTAPTMEIKVNGTTNPIYNRSNSITLNFTTSENIIGFEKSDIVLTKNGVSYSSDNLTNFTGLNSSYHAILNASNPGTYTIKVPASRYQDDNGNTNAQESNTFEWTKQESFLSGLVLVQDNRATINLLINVTGLQGPQYAQIILCQNFNYSHYASSSRYGTFILNWFAGIIPGTSQYMIQNYDYNEPLYFVIKIYNSISSSVPLNINGNSRDATIELSLSPSIGQLGNGLGLSWNQFALPPNVMNIDHYQQSVKILYIAFGPSHSDYYDLIFNRAGLARELVCYVSVSY